MNSLVNYGSDGENSNNSDDAKISNEEKSSIRSKQDNDANYDPVQMDMSEESNNNHSSEQSDSEEGTQSPQSSRSLSSSKLEPARPRTSPTDQRRTDHDSHKSSYRGDSKRSDNRNDRSHNSEERCRRSSNDDKRSRDYDHKDSRKREDDRKHRDDDRRRDKNSTSGREDRREDRRDDRRDDRDKKDKDRRHGSDRSTRTRDRDRRHFRSERTKDRHRDERSSHQKDKDRGRSRSRSRSKDRVLSFRPMSYREEKGRNKLAQLEKLGIELKAPEGSAAMPALFKEQNYYNPLTTATAGKYAEQIQKRKLLWANKSKQDESKNTAAVGSNTWVGTTFTHDEDGKMTAKFKRLMGIKNEVPTAPAPGAKPDILKKQEEMFSNMEQQYEVARATTHTQRGVGLGYASSGYQFPR